MFGFVYAGRGVNSLQPTLPRSSLPPGGGGAPPPPFPAATNMPTLPKLGSPGSYPPTPLTTQQHAQADIGNLWLLQIFLRFFSSFIL